MLKGYRLTRRGWIVLFLLVIMIVAILVFTASAIIANVDKVVKITNQFISGESTLAPKVVVYFENGQATIKEKNLSVLDMILKASESRRNYTIEITCFVVVVEEGVPISKIESQRKLSLARQENVKKYFIDNGQNPNKIVLKENKESLLRINTENIDDDKEVRKIEVSLILKK